MLDPIHIIKIAGLVGIASIIFAESGLFFCFFLPGDTLLFSAGIFASQGLFNLGVLILVCAVAAILGGLLGYWSGLKLDQAFFDKKDSIFFSKKQLLKTQNFYEKYGKATIVIARFIPVIRTFAPVVASIAKMNKKRFVVYNSIGGALWTFAITTLGFYFGGIIPNPDRFVLPIVTLAVALSFAPFVIKTLRFMAKK